MAPITEGKESTMAHGKVPDRRLIEAFLGSPEKGGHK